MKFPSFESLNPLTYGGSNLLSVPLIAYFVLNSNLGLINSNFILSTPNTPAQPSEVAQRILTCRDISISFESDVQGLEIRLLRLRAEQTQNNALRLRLLQRADELASLNTNAYELDPELAFDDEGNPVDGLLGSIMSRLTTAEQDLNDLQIRSANQNTVNYNTSHSTSNRNTI